MLRIVTGSEAAIRRGVFAEVRLTNLFCRGTRKHCPVTPALSNSSCAAARMLHLVPKDELQNPLSGVPSTKGPGHQRLSWTPFVDEGRTPSFADRSHGRTEMRQHRRYCRRERKSLSQFGLSDEVERKVLPAAGRKAISRPCVDCC